MYIGVSTSFQALDFGEDFMGYLPEDVLVMEEIEEGEVLRVAEVPLVPEPTVLAPTVAEREAESFNPPPMGPFKTSTPNRSSSSSNLKVVSPKKSPKKDIERDGITSELIKKKRGRGRPRKADKIVHQPSRLREVTNAEDIQTPKQSPTSANDALPGPADDGQRPSTPPKSIQSLARSPFKDYASPYLPPKHSASFPSALPAQPAPISPLEGLSRLSDSDDAADENVDSGPRPNVREAVTGSDVPGIDAPLPKVQDAAKNSDVTKNTTTPDVQSNLKDSDLQGKTAAIPNVQKAVKDSDLPNKDGTTVRPSSSTPIVEESASESSHPPTSSLAELKPSIIAQLSGQAPLPKTYGDFFDQRSTSPTRLAPQSKQSTPLKSKLEVPGAQGSSNDLATPTSPATVPQAVPAAALQSSPTTASPAKRDREADALGLQGSPAKKPRLEQPDQIQQVDVESIIGSAKSIGKKLMKPFEGNGNKLPKLGDPSRPDKVNDSGAAKIGEKVDSSDKVNDSEGAENASVMARPSDNVNDSDGSSKFGGKIEHSGSINNLDIAEDVFVLDPSKTTVEVQIPAPKRALWEVSAGTFEREGSPAKRAKKIPAAKKAAGQPKATQSGSTPQVKASAKGTKAVKGKAVEMSNGEASETAKGKNSKAAK
jgi:hypothetical protein